MVVYNCALFMRSLRDIEEKSITNQEVSNGFGFGS